MKENIQLTEPVTQEQAYERLLNSIPEESPLFVTLPSRGKGYKTTKETVKLRPITFEDEKLMVTAKGRGPDIINILIYNCTEGIDINELYFFDKLYLLIKLREISYGPIYNSLVICPDCKGENELSLNLDKLTVKEVPEEFNSILVLKLKKTKCTANLRIPNTNLEQFISEDATLETNLWRFIESIETDEGKITDKALISKILDKLPLIDKKYIIKSLSVDYGIQTKVKFICSHCNSSRAIDLPLNSDFFTVS